MLVLDVTSCLYWGSAEVKVSTVVHRAHMGRLPCVYTAGKVVPGINVLIFRLILSLIHPAIETIICAQGWRGQSIPDAGLVKGGGLMKPPHTLIGHRVWYSLAGGQTLASTVHFPLDSVAQAGRVSHRDTWDHWGIRKVPDWPLKSLL